MTETPLARAIAKVGGPAKVAALFGIRSQAVSQWTRCPAERCRALAEATGGDVSAHELRPDLYDAPESKAA